MTYYMYFIQTLVIRCTINELHPLESSVTFQLKLRLKGIIVAIQSNPALGS